MSLLQLIGDTILEKIGEKYEKDRIGLILDSIELGSMFVYGFYDGYGIPSSPQMFLALGATGLNALYREKVYIDELTVMDSSRDMEISHPILLASLKNLIHTSVSGTAAFGVGYMLGYAAKHAYNLISG